MQSALPIKKKKMFWIFRGLIIILCLSGPEMAPSGQRSAAVASFPNHKFRVDRIVQKDNETGLGTGFTV